MTSSLTKIIFLMFMHMPLIFGAAEPGPSQWLAPHNNARKAVGVPPLRWDNKLATFAKSYGNKRKNDCAMIHSTAPYGENIYWSSSQATAPSQAVAGWVSEKRWYNVRTNVCRGGKDCGHYTQVVWKRSTKVGCAKVVCEGSRGAIFVCEYDPPGNFNGEKPY